MMSKIFFDTNTLVYLFDEAFPEKQKKMQEFFVKMEEQGDEGVISTQVMQEFFVVATKKLNIEPIQVKVILKSFEEFEIISVEKDLIYESVDCGVVNQLSFWDSLIVTAAKQSHCNVLLTEDLNNGQEIQGLKILNPFV